jgi:phosphoribosylformimino-5-aminoimidazole carboxamide ribotide isomerase
VKLYPAMDLYNHHVVRLEQGDFQRLTHYPQDPLQTALTFAKEGAQGLHIIDLEAAQTGQGVHQSLIIDMAQQLEIPVQVGGGIRSYETAKHYLDHGVAKVILGTLVFTKPLVFQRLLAEYPGRIIVALDVLDETVMVQGWQQSSNLSLWSVLNQLHAAGVTEILVTDIQTDGMLQGPSLALYQTLQSQTSFSIIASGGIRHCEDIQQLARAQIDAAVIGKALYEHHLTFKEALQCLHAESSLA